VGIRVESRPLRPQWWQLLHTATINLMDDSISITCIPIVIQLHLSHSSFSWLVAITADDIKVWTCLSHYLLEQIISLQPLQFYLLSYWLIEIKSNKHCFDLTLVHLKTNMKDRFAMVALQNLFRIACGWCVTYVGYSPLVLVGAKLVKYFAERSMVLLKEVPFCF
jgi:hypothetical protein